MYKMATEFITNLTHMNNICTHEKKYVLKWLYFEETKENTFRNR